MSVRNESKRNIRHNRVRAKISGTNERPRLSVFKSNTTIYAQVIDDMTGNTLAASSSKEIKKDKTPTEQAQFVGEDIAKKAQEKGIKSVVFDRGGYIYGGRVKVLADAARTAGLEF